MTSDLVTARHLCRKAVIYIRQSTPHQVLTNQESLRLQYALHQRARDLGWDETGIQVIDTDLGLSGATATHREGFRDRIARVTLGEVGLVLSSEVTRLARNCSDWYPLLDLCGYRQCLIGDRDGVYDPGSANGRLLLGCVFRSFRPGVSVHSAICDGFAFADLGARCPALGGQTVSDQGCRLRLWGSPVKPAAIRRRKPRHGGSRRRLVSYASSRP